ncbi:hypothetical protein ACRQ5D_10875 [Mucilaginibacter sp. P25]|uniref:hypothetical protein n=1 Tax=Mucilaginibacter sp. P25 TaxID=3423945 RepID=UPI003D7918DB
MTDELLIEDNVALMSGVGVAVQMEPAAKPTSGTVSDINSMGGPFKVAYWGDDNNFPNTIRDILAKDAEMKELINWCVRSSMGKGLVCLNEIDRDNQGNPMYEAIKDRAITDWFYSIQTRKYCLEAFIDLFTYFNVFPELIVTKDRSRIYSIATNEAIHCRWEQMGDDGKLKNVIHNKNWPYVNLEDTNQTTKIPAIDPYDFDIVNNVKSDPSQKKFIYPLNYPTIGSTYYQVAHWDGLRVSGWLEIAAKIPEFKMALLKNQMTIKYLIRIPNAYWPSVYKNWDKLDEKAQAGLKKAKLKEINDSLSDVKNAGKSILNEVGIDPVTKEKIPGWEIVVIDDKTKPGAFTEDSREASSLKMRALGLDPVLPGGLQTGSSMGAGSGSDKQVAQNISLSMIDPYRDIVLDPLHFAARFNGHYDQYPGFTIKFRDSIMDTVNGHNQTKTEGLS